MRSWSKYAAGLLAAVGIYLISIDTTLAQAEETDSRVIEIELGCYKTVAPMQQYLLESYGEKPLATAMSSIQWKGKQLVGKLILFVNPKSRTFTNAIVFKDGTGCILNSGIEFAPFINGKEI
jgi:hypothetical protein